MPRLKPNTPFRLLDLPSELVDSICEHLDDTSLLSIRRVCRLARSSSVYTFGKRFFQHLIAFLHPLSLATLLEIARHPELSVFVNRVTINGGDLGHIVQIYDAELENECMHDDLQTSIKLSGLDTIILAEAFRALKNLKAVQIDRECYISGSCTEHQYMGIRCGYLHIFGHQYQMDTRVCDGHSGGERVYELMMTILRSADPEGNLEVDFHLVAWPEDRAPAPYWDVRSPLSETFFSNRAISIETRGEVDTQWIRDLLETTTNVRQLEIRDYSGVGTEWTFEDAWSHSTVCWPQLSRLALENIFVNRHAFNEFLRTHRHTLISVELVGMTMSAGTWTGSIHMLEKILQLEYLRLSLLYEQNPYPTSLAAPEWSWDDNIVLTADGPKEVAVALDTLGKELRTSELARAAHPYKTVYYFQVDLSKAIAAVSKPDL
jgi:hypothetical protein